MRYGIHALSDEELLALILNHGVFGKSVLTLAGEILNRGNFIRLFQGEAELLESIKGIDVAQRLKIHAVMEIARRIQFYVHPITIFKEPEQVFQRYRVHFLSQSREQLILIGLNRRNAVLFEVPIAQGTSQTISFDSQIIFQELLRRRSKRFVLVHNHPAGTIQPSLLDIQGTKRLKEQGQKLGLLLLDHIVISENQYYSMAANHLI